MDHRDRLARQFAGLVDRVGVCRGEAFQDAPHEFHPRRGNGQIVFAAVADDSRRHVSGRLESRVVRIKDGHRVGDCCCLAQKALTIDVLAGGGPGVDRLVEQPEAHHIVQISYAAVDPSLVGEVCGASALAQHRVFQLDTDERPRAAGNVGEVRMRRRYGCDRGCRVV